MFFYKSSVNYVLFDLTRSLHVGNNTGKTTCWSSYNTKLRIFFAKTTVIAVVAKLFFRSSEVVGSSPTKETPFFYEQFNTHTQCYNQLFFHSLHTRHALNLQWQGKNSLFYTRNYISILRQGIRKKLHVGQAIIPNFEIFRQNYRNSCSGKTFFSLQRGRGFEPHQGDTIFLRTIQYTYSVLQLVIFSLLTHQTCVKSTMAGQKQFILYQKLHQYTTVGNTQTSALNLLFQHALIFLLILQNSPKYQF